jgi:hypothetical protein
MRVLFLLGFAALAFAVALGQSTTVVRADDQVLVPATDQLDSVSLDPAVVGTGDYAGTDQRRPGDGLRPGIRPNICLRLSAAVQMACPCSGPPGTGWENHEAYVECVTNALDLLLANNDNARLDECAVKILERATASQIGNEGFECAPRRDLRPRDPGQPHPTRDPNEPHPTRVPRHPHPTPEPTAVP